MTKTKQKTKFKQTEVGEIPEEWEILGFKDTLIKNKIGKKNQIKSSEIKEKGNYIVVDQGQDYIAGYSDEEAKLVEHENPHIVFGDHTRCFKFIDFPYILGADGTKVLTPNINEFDSEFYYFYLKSLDIPNKGYNRHYKYLKEKKVKKPPLSEQKKIAYVLTSIQDAIQKQEEVIDKTKELKKSLMHKLFTEGTRGEPQKQTEIGPIPESWEVVKLKNISVLQYGKGLPKKARIEGDIPVYGSSGIIGYHNDALVNEPGYIIGRKGSIGSVYYSNTAFFPIDTVYYVKETDIKCDRRFFYYLLQNLKLKRLNFDSTIPGLNRNIFYSQRTLLPKSYREQEEIAGALDLLENKIQAAKLKKQKLEELFKSLLHQLMRGKIRVNNLEFEV